MPRASEALKTDLISLAKDGVVPRNTFTELAKKHGTSKQNVGQTARRMKIFVERGK